MKAFLHTIAARLYGFFRSRSLDCDFDQELEQHLAMSIEDKIRRGLTPEEARRTARVELGGVTQLREAGRMARGLPWLEGIAHDLRFAMRGLRRDKAFSVTAIVTLVLAIGLNVTAFIVMDAMLFRGYPMVR